MFVPLLFIPTMMAPIVVGLVWKIMLAGSWGLISYNVIERFGILSDTSIFASPDLALYALIMIDIWQWTPFMMLAFFAGLQALPLNPFRAAAVDGATPIQIFFQLTLPMMTPLLAVIGLLRLIDAFKVFDTLLHPHRRRAWASDRNAEHPRLQDDLRVLEHRPGLGARGPGLDRVLRLLQLVLSTREEPAEGILRMSG